MVADSVGTWCVPIERSSSGPRLAHGIADPLVLVMHRDVHGWRASGTGAARLPHQTYFEDISTLCATAREIVVVGLAGGGWQTLWARSDDEVTYPVPAVPCLPGTAGAGPFRLSDSGGSSQLLAWGYPGELREMGYNALHRPYGQPGAPISKRVPSGGVALYGSARGE